MKKVLVSLLLMAAIAGPAHAETAASPTSHERMKECDAENHAHPVASNDYKNFMKSCVDRQSRATNPGDKQRMDACAAHADESHLNGMARESSIKKCFDHPAR